MLHASVRQTSDRLPFAKHQRRCKEMPLLVFCNERIKDISFREF